MKEDLKNLNSLFQQLEKTKIPSFSGNDAFDNWIENLIQIDAHLAGLACSLLGGEKLTPNQFPEIISLEKDFENVTKNNKIDCKIFEQCKSYLDLLIRLHLQLFLLTKSNLRGQK